MSLENHRCLPLKLLLVIEPKERVLRGEVVCSLLVLH
jgi:hypothetical protein